MKRKKKNTWSTDGVHNTSTEAQAVKHKHKHKHRNFTKLSYKSEGPQQWVTDKKGQNYLSKFNTVRLPKKN